MEQKRDGYYFPHTKSHRMVHKMNYSATILCCRLACHSQVLANKHAVRNNTGLKHKANLLRDMTSSTHQQPIQRSSSISSQHILLPDANGLL